MEEARRVIERLDRIDALRGAGAPAHELLGEVRKLLEEGEDWLAAEREGAERDGPERAADALERCRALLGAGREEAATAPI